MRSFPTSKGAAASSAAQAMDWARQHCHGNVAEPGFCPEQSRLARRPSQFATVARPRLKRVSASLGRSYGARGALGSSLIDATALLFGAASLEAGRPRKPSRTADVLRALARGLSGVGRVGTAGEIAQRLAGGVDLVVVAPIGKARNSLSQVASHGASCDNESARCSSSSGRCGAALSLRTCRRPQSPQPRASTDLPSDATLTFPSSCQMSAGCGRRRRLRA